jgi:hypothetical protein
MTAASFQLPRAARRRALKPPKQGGRCSRFGWVSGDGSFADPGNSATADTMVRRFVRESAAMTSNSWLKVGQSWIVKTVWMKRRPVPMYDPYATPDDPYARPKPYRGVSNAHEDQAVS